MHLTHLSLTNFRNFTRLDMDLPRRILLLVGDNAQGKTSLLEAVYYLATFSSLQAQNDRQLINFSVMDDNPAVARIVADYEKENHPHRLEIRLILEKNGGNGSARFRKEILLDGIKRSAQEALRSFNAVIFLPQMTRIIEGGPEERRRYLNLALAQVIPGYGRVLSEYTQAITQRNALLKILSERSNGVNQLDYWNGLLTERGAFLIYQRLIAVQEFEKQATKIHHELTHGQEVLSLVYQPTFETDLVEISQNSMVHDRQIEKKAAIEKIQQIFLKQLKSVEREEIARGVTTLGPHRDELRFLTNAIDLGNYGSRGQIRTALLSLKFSEVAWMKEKTGSWPVLLLDETLAELDTQRRADLLKYLSQSEQAILTTTDLKLFSEEFTNSSTVWKIVNGFVSLD